MAYLKAHLEERDESSPGYGGGPRRRCRRILRVVPARARGCQEVVLRRHDARETSCAQRGRNFCRTLWRPAISR